ncbi:MAG: winged helix-turn-helix domain-containing protein [Haloplanus sp.]
MRQRDDDSASDVHPFADEDDDANADDSAAVFAALSDPLRVEILEALAAHHREQGPRTPVGFADLRRRVDVRDSGRFRYHLRKLQDHFVRGTDEGYRLTHAGTEVVAAILAGTYTEQPSLGPADLDSHCPLCGGTARATYEEGFCMVTCPGDHALFGWAVPPNAVSDATLPEVVELAERLGFQAMELAIDGVCPKCYSPVQPGVVVDDPQPKFAARCDTCGGRERGPVGFCLFVDPQVAAFYRRHGRPLEDRHPWELPFAQGEETLAGVHEDPVRIEFELALDDEVLAVTVDDSGRVVAADRREREG